MLPSWWNCTLRWERNFPSSLEAMNCRVGKRLPRECVFPLTVKKASMHRMILSSIGPTGLLPIPQRKTILFCSITIRWSSTGIGFSSNPTWSWLSFCSPVCLPKRRKSGTLPSTNRIPLVTLLFPIASRALWQANRSNPSRRGHISRKPYAWTSMISMAILSMAFILRLWQEVGWRLSMGLPVSGTGRGNSVSTRRSQTPGRALRSA